MRISTERAQISRKPMHNYIIGPIHCKMSNIYCPQGPMNKEFFPMHSYTRTLKTIQNLLL